MKPTLQQWLQMIDAYVGVSGDLYHPANTYINVHIRQNAAPHRELKLMDGDTTFGRSSGDSEKVPNIYEAVTNLLSELTGNRVTFGEGVLVVPELDTTGLADAL